MRILYLHQHFSTPFGSTGTRSYEMARRLLSRGHDVTVVCGSYDGGVTGLSQPFKRGMRRGLVYGIDVIEFDLKYSNSHRYLRRTWTFLKFALRCIGLVCTERYDLVFATTTPLTVGIPGIFARWGLGKPFVFEVRDLWPDLPRAMREIRNPVVLWAMGLLELASYRSAHRLLGLSPGIVEGIFRRGVPRESITMVPNGCDLDIFCAQVRPWRPESIRPSDFMAIFAGSHGKANGLDIVIDAAAELKHRGRDNIKLLLIGDGKLKPSLQARARCEGLSNVVFHEPVDKSRLADLMAAADIGLQILANVPAFYFGTSPNKFFDYIAAGLPVLVNYPGWIAQIITENRCGFVVPPDNPSALADTLEQADLNYNSTREMGRRAQELGRREFDRDKLASQWIDWVTMGKK